MLDVQALRLLPLPLARRILRAWIRGRGVPDVGADTIEAALGVLHAPSRPAVVNLPAGWRVRRRSGVLFLDRQKPAS
jgi:hypothetical protein